MLSGPYRVGPWPGLTPRGAIVLLECAGLLAVLLGAQNILLGGPNLLVLAIAALLPMAIATRVVNTPGAATAATGAYLLPTTLLSLVKPEVELPPLLLVPAFAFDIALWLRWSDLRCRKVRRSPRRTITWQRAALAGAVFGFVLSVVESSFELFMGQAPDEDVVLASLIAIVASSVVALLSVRDRAS